MKFYNIHFERLIHVILFINVIEIFHESNEKLALKIFIQRTFVLVLDETIK